MIGSGTRWLLGAALWWHVPVAAQTLVLSPHEPTRVDKAVERSVASCRGLEVSIERPLISEATRQPQRVEIAVNGRLLSANDVEPMAGYLGDLDSTYRIVFTCGHNGVIGVRMWRTTGSRSGTPSYSVAAAYIAASGLVSFDAPEVETAENFWLR